MAYRVRYPFRAFLAVGVAALLLVVQVFAGALFCVVFLPLVPLFVAMVIAGAGLLSSALQYAASVARFEPRKAKLGRPSDAQSIAKKILPAPRLTREGRAPAAARPA
jgi:O-antigen/teichoic acid export membrane protein